MSDLIYDVNTGCFAGTTPTVPQAPAVADEFVFEQEANMIERDLRFYVARLHTYCVPLRERLLQAEARVAILDAQEVELPQIPGKPREMTWADYWRDVALRQREQIALDALRAVQAWREVARLYQSEHRKWGCVTSGNEICSACKSYDALARKDGE